MSVLQPLVTPDQNEAGSAIPGQNGGVTVELVHIETFLVVAEELHFGRAADRLRVDAAQVTRRVQVLERSVGARLLERTSRRVALTPLGRDMRPSLQPAYEALVASLASTRTAAASTQGRVVVGYSDSAAGHELDELCRRFEQAHPEATLELVNVSLRDQIQALESGEIDVLISWLALAGGEVKAAAPLAQRRRALAVGAGHRLARAQQVSVEELPDLRLPTWVSTDPFLARMAEAMWPEVTPGGRPIPRSGPEMRTLNDMASAVARGKIEHATVEGVVQFEGNPEIVVIPIIGLPPMELGLLVVHGPQNARVRALLAIAAQLSAGQGAGEVLD